MTASRFLPVLGLVALALGACDGCGPSAAEVRSATLAAQEHTHQARDRADRQAVAAAVAATVGAAEQAVAAAAADFDPHSLRAYLARCHGSLTRGDTDAARACVAEARAQGQDDLELDFVEADALLAAHAFDEARTALFAIRDRQPLAEGLEERLISAFRDDPHFLRPVETIEPGVQADQLRALGGGSTITLKFKLNGTTVAAFKPDQTRRQSNYRAEVAAYRLCPIIRCGFEVPYSFEARIEYRDFLRLYGIPSLEGQSGYAANFTDLVWQTEDGHQYLHGVWKDWVPHFAEFPIEYDQIWDSWVSTAGDPAELDQPLEEALAPLRRLDRSAYDQVMAERGDVTTRDLARQISNLIVFDFLINNWDRFSGAYYGVNCQWADGHFVSIDNGAGFMPRDPERPRARLHELTRFSRSLIQEVRLLDTDALLPILFPNPTDQETRDFASFWTRRQELLDYVDGLIQERGEDAVLAFE